MSSEREGEILGEIEARLAVESPRLARALRRERDGQQIVYDVLVGLTVATMLLCMVLAQQGLFGSAVLCALLAAVILLARHRRRPYSWWPRPTGGDGPPRR